MAVVYSFLMNKGGVGKTSLVTNLSSALHLKEPSKRILIIDTDGQGNCALSFKINPERIENTIYDCLVNGLPTDQAIISIRDNLDLLPANGDMNFFELDVLPNLKRRNPFLFLKTVVDRLRETYDYIFIDAPPDMKVVAGNVMMVSDYIYLPFKPEVYSVQGLIRVIHKIEQFKKDYEIDPEIAGIIGMMVKRTNLHSGLMLQADAYCKKKNQLRLLKTRIPDSIRYADAIRQYGMPIVLADPKSAHSKLFFDLLEEVIDLGEKK